jgi:hypothetical protein
MLYSVSFRMHRTFAVCTYVDLFKMLCTGSHGMCVTNGGCIIRRTKVYKSSTLTSSFVKNQEGREGREGVRMAVQGQLMSEKCSSFWWAGMRYTVWPCGHTYIPTYVSGMPNTLQQLHSHRWHESLLAPRSNLRALIQCTTSASRVCSELSTSLSPSSTVCLLV